MGFAAILWAYEQTTGSPGAKSVLVALAKSADDDHYCYPSQEKLAEMTEQKARTVRLHLATLETRGLIARIRRRRADGTFLSDGFVLAVADQRQNLPAAESASGKKPQEPAAKNCTDQRQNLPPRLPIKRPPEREPIPPMGEGEINTPRTHTRTHARFSPSHPELTPEEIAADAAAVGVTPGEYAGYLPQWSDARLSSGQSSADWRADARKFVRAAVQIDQRARASPNGRASPPVTFAQQREANNAAAWAELDAIVKGTGNGLRPHLQAADEPPRRGLPRGDPGDDDGRVLDGLFRER